MSLGSEDEQLHRKWDRERLFDKRLLMILCAITTTLSLGMRFLPFPWNWRALQIGVVFVAVAGFAECFWTPIRQVRRMRALTKLAQEAAARINRSHDAEPDEDEPGEHEDA